MVDNLMSVCSNYFKYWSNGYETCNCFEVRSFSRLNTRVAVQFKERIFHCVEWQIRPSYDKAKVYYLDISLLHTNAIM